MHRLHERTREKTRREDEFGRGGQKPLKPLFLNKLTITENGVTPPRATCARHNAASNAPGLIEIGGGEKSVYF